MPSKSLCDELIGMETEKSTEKSPVPLQSFSSTCCKAISKVVKERIAQDLQTKVKKATVKSNPLNQARLHFFANQIYTTHKYYIYVYVYI